MLPALGAVSSLLDSLQSLTRSKSSTPQATGFSQSSSDPFDLSGNTASAGSAPASAPGGCSQLSPATMSALLAAQSQASAATTTPAPTSRADALKDLFSKLDANGDGQISKTEFEDALGAGGTNIANADNVLGKMDTNGDGNISLDEMSSALQGSGKGHHHHHRADGSDKSPLDSLLQALDASSTSVTNSDGSTTTSLTYADGSKVTMTSPAASTSSSSATSSYNFIEQMIQREAQAISSGATVSLSLNV